MQNLIRLFFVFCLVASSVTLGAEVNANKGQIRDLQNQIDELRAELGLREPEVFDLNCSGVGDQELLQSALDRAIPGDRFNITGTCSSVNLQIRTDRIQVWGDGETTLVGSGQGAAITFRQSSDTWLADLTVSGAGRGIQVGADSQIIAVGLSSSGNDDGGMWVETNGKVVCVDCEFNGNKKQGLAGRGEVFACGRLDVSRNGTHGLYMATGARFISDSETCKSWGVGVLNLTAIENGRFGMLFFADASARVNSDGMITSSANGDWGMLLESQSTVFFQGVDFSSTGNLNGKDVYIAQSSSLHLNNLSPGTVAQGSMHLGVFSTANIGSADGNIGINCSRNDQGGLISWVWGDAYCL